MTTVINGVIKEWGERTYYGNPRGRKGRNINGGRSIFKTPSKPKRQARGRLVDTVRKTPEVMVKISGGGKNMGQIKAHFDYISRNGDIEVEDDKGDVYTGREDVRELRDNWRDEGYRIAPKNGKKREAFNIILSMPPDTDRESVKRAARDFAGDVFSTHQYVFVAHEDERHPHVHLAVKAVDRNGVRLNPRKADLQHWREMFADKLHDHGIAANATPRQVRGVDRKPVKQAVRHIDAEYTEGTRQEPARVTASQRADADKELASGVERKHPAYRQLKTARKEQQQSWGRLARALARGDDADRRLALDVTRFVDAIPASQTLQQALIAERQSAHGQDRPRGRNQTHESERTPPDRQPDRE